MLDIGALATAIFESEQELVKIDSILITFERTMDILETIKEQIEQNPIIIYMKGSPEQPQCGFSAQSTQMLMACGEKFAYIDILANPEIRATLPEYSDWPTFPQLFVEGELVGGCDILTEMYENGELQTLLSEASQRAATPTE